MHVHMNVLISSKAAQASAEIGYTYIQTVFYSPKTCFKCFIMNIPCVSVWKAGNGIFIEYFWEYLWETLVIKSVFVLPRHNFCFSALHLSLCFCVLCLIVYTVLFSYLFSLPGFSTTSKPELSKNFNLNLICNALPQ